MCARIVMTANNKEILEAYRNLTIAQIEKFEPDPDIQLYVNLGWVTLELSRLEKSDEV